MNISQKGLSLICSFEGFKAFPYQDAKGVWTIGYGTTVYPNGYKVTYTDMALSEQQAVDCMKYHIEARVIPVIEKNLPNRANKYGKLEQNQVDAICSFIYNVGAKAFEGSTLLKDIKAGATQEAITAGFMMWVKSGGMLLKGLVARRKAEAEYYNSSE